MIKNPEDFFPFICHQINDSSDYRLEHGIASWIAQRMFLSVDVEGLEQVIKRKEAKDHPVIVYVPRHLSEFDWQEIQRSLIEWRMMAAIQAGDNLLNAITDGPLRHQGAYKILREKRKIYSTNSLWNDFLTWLAIVKIEPVKPTVIRSLDSLMINQAYERKVVVEERRDLVKFLEEDEDKVTKIKKMGRSYTGVLLPFATAPFGILSKISAESGVPICIVPVNVSYERVIEDESFLRLRKLKANTRTRSLTYAYDYFFNYVLSWFQKSGRVVIKYGEPIPLPTDLKTRQRKEYADLVRTEVGALQTIFPTQVLAKSWGQIVGKGWGFSAEIEQHYLEERIKRTKGYLENLGADLRYVEGLNAQEIIEAAFPHFYHRRRPVLDKVGDLYVVERAHIFKQYENHIRHLFVEPKP